MLALRSPQEVYRRVEFDARIAGANPRELVLVCFEQLNAALGRALHAAAAGDNAAKSEAITRALSAIAALLLGIDPAARIAPVLRQFYQAARQALLGCALDFRPAVLERWRGDFAEIGRSLALAE